MHNTLTKFWGWESYSIITTNIAFLFVTFIVFAITLNRDRIRSQGYQTLSPNELEIVDSKTTLTEGLIFFATICQFGAAIAVSIISFLADLDIELLFHLSFCIGWFFQLSILYMASYTNSSAPRYSFLRSFIALASQSITVYYILKAQETDYLYKILNLSSLVLIVLLILLDFINPAKNAHILESIKVNGRLPSSEVTASPFSIISFSWVNGLLGVGFKKPLEREDLPHLSKEDQMENIVEKWRAFRDNSKNSVVWDSLLFTQKFAWWQLTLTVASTILDFAKPFFINRLLVWIQSKPPGSSNLDGYLLLGGMFICTIIREILYGQIYLSGRHWGIQLRSAFVYEIFNKSLRRTGGAAMAEEDDSGQKASQGKIVSLMSSDVNSLKWFLTDIHVILIDIPLSVFISITGLLVLMGPSALAGMVVIIVSGPISSWALTRLYKLLKATRTFCDKRIQVTNEALLGIRIIKYMAWETKFISKMLKAREDELNSRLSLLQSNLILTCITWGSSILVTFVSFFFYTIVAGHTLDAATAFTAISLLSSLSSVLNDISQTVSQVLNIRVTLARINSFLEEEELGKFNGNLNENNLNRDTWIGFKDGEFGYYGPTTGDVVVEDEEQQALLSTDPESSPSFRLRGVNIQFPVGKLTAVIGPTGSGKTSLLLALLGEMKKISGEYSISERHLSPHATGEKSDVAYVSQSAWLMSATIKENVLFGEPFDKDRYLQVLKACALLRDLDNLEYGDLTEIGEKGVNLSGGQKQRVSLARAAYSTAPIVLLDDPLSAVDSPTARLLLHNCILNLFKGRTVILVTHTVSLVLPKSDHVVAVKNGSILTQGSPSDVVKSGILSDILSIDLFKSKSEDDLLDDMEPELKSIPQRENREGKAAGSVKWTTYQSYITATGGIMFLLGILSSYGIQVSADYLQNWWIEVWTDNMPIQALTSTFAINTNFLTEILVRTPVKQMGVLNNDSHNDSLYYISIFGLISFIELFALLFKYVIQFMGGIRASRIMHEKLANAVLGSPMRFFETTPVGRIINRFSKDLSDIDLQVIWTLTVFGTFVLGAFLRILLVSAVTPPFAFSAVLILFYWRIARYYLASSREIKRLESVSNSPIYALFGEVLNGVSTIRAFGSEPQFIQSILKRVDANHRAYFYLFATNRWLNIRSSMLSCMIVFAAGISILLTNITAGWAGLAINFASQITSMINRTIQIHSSLEMSMNAVERIDEYAALPQEPIESHVQLENWPTKGKIQVKDLVIRYSPDLPEVLKGISFSIDGKEKVGVVGRSGAGKSTLSLAFFRILPFSGGTIYIDDVDISTLGVRDLRSRLTIIPQDPVLFEGTLRSNLDPLDEHSDSSIWDALRLTHVLESLQDAGKDEPISLSLDSPVNENGGNFSQGQKQLLCLARALLRHSKFIFMDESTASVDSETDAKIQDTIRKEFSSATILTVAHRLRTVIDYDKVLVLDNGKVEEFGHPYELLLKKGMFFKMCQETGEFDELYSMASSVYKKQRNV